MKEPQVEARRWLQQSQSDFEVVRILNNAGHYAAACFHGQQVAEKALKAVLYGQGQRLVLGRSVRDLVRQCQVVDKVFVGLESDGALLDQFYIPTRYPNGLPFPAVPSETYGAAQATFAEEAAGRVLQAAENYLGKVINRANATENENSASEDIALGNSETSNENDS